MTLEEFEAQRQAQQRPPGMPSAATRPGELLCRPGALKEGARVCRGPGTSFHSASQEWERVVGCRPLPGTEGARCNRKPVYEAKASTCVYPYDDMMIIEDSSSWRASWPPVTSWTDWHAGACSSLW